MILVTGATGHLGSETIKYLLKNTAAEHIAALVRDEAKAKHWRDKGVRIRVGDYTDTASLENAMQGIEKVLLISGNEPGKRLQQHSNVINAAKKRGVKQIVYTGIAINDISTSVMKPFMEELFRTEDHIRESGMAYTLLRNTLYTDGIPMFIGEKAFETGIYLPTGTGKVPFALRREMGEAATNILLQNGHEGKIYTIAGNELYTYKDVAQTLSELSGKTITYTAADPETFPGLLRGAGVPEIVVSIVAGISADISNGQYAVVSNDLEILLGRKPVSLKAGLREIYNF